jgi:acetoacetyl-CoA reductase
MKNRVACVTGGVGTIGTAICVALYEGGCKAVGVLDVAENPEWEAEMKRQGYDIPVVACDVTDFDSVAEAVKTLEGKIGPVDILVNAAGITRDTTLRKMSADQWRQVIDVNLTGVFNVTRQVINGMLERKHGRIINISSVNGQKGQFGQANYSASKAGIHGFTKAVAQEVARKGVTVNTLSPGYIDSPMINAVPEEIRNQIREGIPVGRFGQPEEVARVVAFLAADESGYITGADFSVNGGQHMY